MLSIPFSSVLLALTGWLLLAQDQCRVLPFMQFFLRRVVNSEALVKQSPYHCRVSGLCVHSQYGVHQLHRLQ